MADFNIAQKLVSKAEGGYSNDPKDRGNWTSGIIGVGENIGTNFGISAPTLVAELKRLGGNPPTASTMKNLEYVSALAIYERNYWNPIKGDQIKSQKLSNMIYDMGVNMGVGAARKAVRDSLGISTYDVSKINEANSNKLFNDIGKIREEKYKSLGGYALNSWLDRLKNLGYSGAGIIKSNPMKTIAVIIGLSAAVYGIIMYINKK